MAIINCSECNKQISDKSEVCVGCGAPPEVFKSPVSKPTKPVIPKVNLSDEDANLDSGSHLNYQNNNNSTQDTSNSSVNDTEEINFNDSKDDNPESKNIEITFDKADPRYRVYKITNTVLFILISFLDAGYAASQGMRANVFGSFVTFMISRYVIRYYFAKRTDFRDGSDMFKIGASLIIWFIVFIFKTIIGLIILNVAL